MTKEEIDKRDKCDDCAMFPSYPAHHERTWVNYHPYNNSLIAHIREQDKAIAEARSIIDRFKRDHGKDSLDWKCFDCERFCIDWLKRYGERK